MKKETIEFLRHEGKGIIQKGKKRFKLKKETTKPRTDGHINKVIFEEINEKQYKIRIDKAAKYLTQNIKAKDIVASVLNDLSLDDLEALERRIQQKCKVKKKRGCFNLVIDNMEISIVE